jgi:hypothetical protein
MSHTSEGRFLYFAYGSNMLTRRLLERTPSATPTGTGYVTGRQLTFDKIGQDGSGKCDAFLTERPGDRVFGVTFEIRSAERDALDAVEGTLRSARRRISSRSIGIAP